MPCRMDDYPEETVLKSVYDAERKKSRQYKKLGDEATRLLCELCHNISTFTPEPESLITPGSELETWWQMHQEKDRKRRERAAAKAAKEQRLAAEQQERIARREAALNKLTDEDKKLLGL